MIQAIPLAALVGGALFLVIWLGMRHPALLRLGLRNTTRRPTQTLITIAGLVLSTVLITTFIALPDSLNSSTVADRLARVGYVDESVTDPLTQDQVIQALARLEQVSQVQAATVAFLQEATVTSERTQVSFGSQPSDSLYLLAAAPAFDQIYGPIADHQGPLQHFADLRPGEVLISNTLAQRFDVRPGDQLQIKQNGLEGTITGTVRAILSTDLVLTTAELAGNAALSEVILSTATMQQVFARRYHRPFVANMLCVKNAGSGGLDDSGPNGSRSQAVLRDLQSIFRVAPVDISDPTITRDPTDLTRVSIHPLKPGAVEFQGPEGFSGNESMIPVISSKLELGASPAARQFFLLLPTFSCLLVGAIIIGAGSFMARQMLAQPSEPPTHGKITPTSNQANESGVPANGPQKRPGNAQTTVLGQNDPQIYWNTIRAQFAQEIRLSVSEVQQKLQAANALVKAQHSDPGAPVSDLAAQQGLSPDQLRAMEISAIQQGCAKLVNRRALTQQQADQRTQTAQSWDQSTLNQYILYAFNSSQNTQKQ